MAILTSVRKQPAGILFGFIIASLLFLATFALALRTGGVLATHAGNNAIHACVSVYDGDTRILLPGQALNCSAGEMLVDPGGGLTETS